MTIIKHCLICGSIIYAKSVNALFCQAKECRNRAKRADAKENAGMPANGAVTIRHDYGGGSCCGKCAFVDRCKQAIRARGKVVCEPGHPLFAEFDNKYQGDRAIGYSVWKPIVVDFHRKGYAAPAGFVWS